MYSVFCLCVLFCFMGLRPLVVYGRSYIPIMKQSIFRSNHPMLSSRGALRARHLKGVEGKRDRFRYLQAFSGSSILSGDERDKKEDSAASLTLSEPVVPSGTWQESARNVEVKSTKYGPLLRADMLCESGFSKKWVHVEMLYVPTLVYRWEFQKIDERSPTCRFTWDNNNGIVKTWDLSGQKEKKKQWFNPITNPQYLFQTAPPAFYARSASLSRCFYYFVVYGS